MNRSAFCKGAGTMRTKELAMRSITPLLIVTALAGCAPAPPQQTAMVDARAQEKLGRLLAGKVAGRPQSCLPSYRSDEMIVIDDNTIAFRDGTDRVWINHPNGGCNMLGSSPYALVTHSVGSMGLCRGDIGHVTDTLNNSTVGSCSMGDFVPYSTPGR